MRVRTLPVSCPAPGIRLSIINLREGLLKPTSRLPNGTAPAPVPGGGGNRTYHAVFVNRVCPPDGGATGVLLRQLADALAARGARVTLLCGPRQPGAGTRTRPLPAGVDVQRVRAPQLSKSRHLLRALGYLALYPAFLLALLRHRRADVIVLMSDPPLLVALAPLLRVFLRMPVVHWAQDLYPEAAVALQVIPPGGWLARVCTWLSNRGLFQCARVVAIGECMRERLVRRGIPRPRVEVLPNWATPGLAEDRRDGSTFRAGQGWGDDFVVMYSGNLGLVHDFAGVLEAARLLQAENAPVRFVFVGGGGRRSGLEMEVRERALRNVQFLPFQPEEDLPEVLRAADLHLVTLLPALAGLVIPSKLYNILAAGRPVLYVGPLETEVARVLLAGHCGDVVSSGLGPDIAACLRARAADLPGRRTLAGQRAQAAALPFTLENLASQWARLLGEVIAPPRAPEQPD